MMQYDIEKLKRSIPVEDYYRSELGNPKGSSNSHLIYLCPFHSDKNNPNLKITKRHGGFTCYACGERGDIIAFHQKHNNTDFVNACKWFSDKYRIECKKLSSKKTKKLNITYDLPPDALVYLRKRGFTDETIKLLKLGHIKYKDSNGDHDAIAIPIKGCRKIDKKFFKLKLYKIKEKGKNWRTYPPGSKATLHGNVIDQDLILVAGEWDLMMMYQNGFTNIVTGTAGEGTFKPEWKNALKDKSITIIYDLDEAGTKGAQNAARILSSAVKELRIVALPKELGDGGDISDFFQKGYNAEDLKKLIAETKPLSKKETADYWVKDNCYFYLKATKESIQEVKVSNFTIEIEKEVEIFDGYEKKRIFEGKIRGSEWNRDFKIDAKSFFNNSKLQESIGDQAGARAQFQPENVKHIRLASQQLSDTRQESILIQFGWKNDETFLTPSVSIDKDGIVGNSEIKVDLSGAENAKFLDLQMFDDEMFKEISKHILGDLMTLHQPDVTYPLIGHVFIAPVMKFQNDTTRYVLWIKGITGGGKSFIARLFQCFFGSFIPDNSIASWTSTMNFIQMVGFYFKDSIFLVDDFKKGNIKDRGQLIRMIQAYADGTGRGRLNPDSTTKQTRPIRGLMLCTGEDIPEHEASVLARMLILECSNKDKHIEEGMRCLKYRQYYNGVMARYIHWLISVDIKCKIDELMQAHTSLFYKGIEGQQNDIRIARNLALNFTGFRLFCDFMLDMGSITKAIHEEMYMQTIDILLLTRDRQIEIVKNEQGSNIFLNTLSDLIGNGRVSIHNPNMTRYVGQGSEPILPSELRNMVGFIKCDDDPYVYVNPAVTYSEVQKIIVQGGGSLNLSKDAIGKQLLDDGFLRMTDSGRTTKKVKYQKSTHRAWVLKKTDIGIEYGNEQ